MYGFQFAGFDFNVPQPFVTFFTVTATFENALKQSGFVTGQETKRASPDWNGFANTLGSPFFDELRAAPSVAIFFEAPPKLLIVSAGHATFKDVPAPVNCQQLFESVRCVRNNLFHGSKVYATPRDFRLVEASLSILEAAITSCEARQELRNVYYAFTFAPLGAG
ncbi:hypothetical protein [Brucella intermedia]|uniref:hypothetical protein n=1 Tax=Brucella intermedia TaxID=94625 RepID=UPI00124EE028|nr:hypothetical protein [Brucella intermedia]KAB2692552.1 hypothetical protein F9K72_20610 [Brucella intermedia]